MPAVKYYRKLPPEWGEHMKRSIASVLLVILLIFCALPGAAAEDDVIFIAANDILLHLYYTPYISRGTVYVPYWVFSNYFKLYYTYFAESLTALLYTDENQIYFDLSTGNTYGAAYEYYPASAVFYQGQVYLPAAFVAGRFGLSYSYISGKDYGDVVRIKDASAILTDSAFISAAASLMRSRYNAYINDAIPTSRPQSSPNVENPGAASGEGTSVYIGFMGLPDEIILNALAVRDIKSCFFLTADEVLSDPATVRLIINSGHGTGALCGENAYEDYKRISSLIFEAAREKTVLISSDPEYRENCIAVAEKYSLVYADFDIDGFMGGSGAPSASYLTDILDEGGYRSDLKLAAGGNTPGILPSLLRHLTQNNFSIREIRETYN